MQNQIQKETHKGLGRKRRREMVRSWKASGTRLTLKAWAATTQLGEFGFVWLQAKRGA